MSIDSDDFEEREQLCLEGVHCSCFADGEPCCYCDRLAGEVINETN